MEKRMAAMYTQQHYEVKDKGYAEGINPKFGEWSQVFNFTPISYSNNRSEVKKAFKESIWALMSNQFVFIEFVSVAITLYLNQQKLMVDLLNRLSKISINDKSIRHQMRQFGSPVMQAYHEAYFCRPILIGFHKSRLIDSGFDLVTLKEWKQEKDTK